MQNEQKQFDRIYNSQIINLPNIKITSNQSSFLENVILHETAETSPFQRAEDVVLTFIIDGQINSSYQGIDGHFLNSTKSCSLIYAPDDNEHRIAGNQNIDSVSIGINKRFFQDLIHPGDNWMEDITNKIERKQSFSFSKNAYKLTPEMFSILHQIRTTKFTGSLKTLYLQGLMSELMILQFSEIMTAQNYVYDLGVKETDKHKIKELKNYIDTHYLETQSLDSLARLFGLNSFKLKTGFKAMYQKSVFEYIRGLRMDHAFKLLMDGSCNITEVAYILGYEHPQHFSTAFKKHFGTSPGKFKK